MVVLSIRKAESNVKVWRTSLIFLATLKNASFIKLPGKICKSVLNADAVSIRMCRTFTTTTFNT
jgi:hypothetical protein